MAEPHTVIIGTRQSQLAVWQAEHVATLIRARYPQIETRLHFIVTHGDRVLDQPLPAIGGKGLFTAELEAALRSGTIDLAVHSLKDLPTELAADFTIAAVPERASPFDVLISRGGQDLAALPVGAVLGTSSLRRVAQLRAYRPDLRAESIRGNVPTRLSKGLDADGDYDGVILAQAGLRRLGLADAITTVLPATIMLPAPAQGALAIQCRADDDALLRLLSPLDHPQSRSAVEAERAFLRMLDSGCRLPVAALGILRRGKLRLTGRVLSPDGDKVITVAGATPNLDIEHALLLGRQLAEQALAQGADDLLEAARLVTNESVAL